MKGASYEEVKAFIAESAEYKLQGDRNDAEAVLLVSSQANEEMFRKMRGEKTMHEWLREFLREDLVEAENIGEMKALIKLVCRKIVKGKTPEEIVNELDEDGDKVRCIYNTAVSFAPGYDADKIYEKMKETVLQQQT